MLKDFWNALGISIAVLFFCVLILALRGRILKKDVQRICDTQAGTPIETVLEAAKESGFSSSQITSSPGFNGETRLYFQKVLIPPLGRMFCRVTVKDGLVTGTETGYLD